MTKHSQGGGAVKHNMLYCYFDIVILLVTKNVVAPQALEKKWAKITILLPNTGPSRAAPEGEAGMKKKIT